MAGIYVGSHMYIQDIGMNQKDTNTWNTGMTVSIIHQWPRLPFTSFNGMLISLLVNPQAHLGVNMNI